MSNTQTLAVTVDTSAVQAFVDQLRTAEPLKILATGEEIPATDPRTDHVAVRFPDAGLIIAVTPLADPDGDSLPNQQAVIDAAKALRLLDRDDWDLCSSADYMRHVIDHSRIGPAVDTNLFPNVNTSDWYWTSTPVPGSSASAFLVYLLIGNVSYARRSYSGFGLACCRARQ